MLDGELDIIIAEVHPVGFTKWLTVALPPDVREGISVRFTLERNVSARFCLDVFWCESNSWRSWNDTKIRMPYDWCAVRYKKTKCML